MSRLIDDIVRKLDENEPLDVDSCKRLLLYGLYDSVSGLKNRHALDLRIRDIETKSKNNNVGVVFADVNGLKFTNDNYGHNAGDTLIRKCAFLLISHFGKENCYRTSGDEFVVIVDECEDYKFLTEITSFKRMINDKNIPPISIGWYYNDKCNNVKLAINKAEEEIKLL